MIFTIIAFVLCSFLHGYYYDGVETVLINRANAELTNNFKEPIESEKFEIKARDYVQTFAYKDKMEVSVINEYGTIMFSSLGYVSSNANMLDYIEAFNNPDKETAMVLELSTGEKVMAITKPLPTSDTQDLPRALRFVISLEKVDARVYQGYAVVILICSLIVAVAFASSIYFIRSVVGSVRDIESQTSLIAEGNFDVRITKKYNDEIGELSDSINNMAVELGKIDKMKYDFISILLQQCFFFVTSTFFVDFCCILIYIVILFI